MQNILEVLAGLFGTMVVLISLFIFLCSRTEQDEPEFQTRFRDAYNQATDSEVGARMVGAFFTANDQPLRMRWKLFWGFLLLTTLSIGGLYLV
jgi:hypothetical protein